MINVDYTDVFPISMPLKSCSNIFLLLKYLVMQYASYDYELNKINFFPKPIGILSKTFRKIFLS